MNKALLGEIISTYQIDCFYLRGRNWLVKIWGACWSETLLGGNSFGDFKAGTFCVVSAIFDLLLCDHIVWYSFIRFRPRHLALILSAHFSMRMLLLLELAHVRLWKSVFHQIYIDRRMDRFFNLGFGAYVDWLGGG